MSAHARRLSRTRSRVSGRCRARRPSLARAMRRSSCSATATTDRACLRLNDPRPRRHPRRLQSRPRPRPRPRAPFPSRARQPRARRNRPHDRLRLHPRRLSPRLRHRIRRRRHHRRPGRSRSRTGVEVIDSTAAYAPDGSAFAFTARPADGSHGPDIYVWNVGDAEATPITSDHRSVFGSWAGDTIVGSTVVTSDDGQTNEPAAFTWSPDGGTNVPLPQAGLAWRPAVDPSEGSAVYWAGTLKPSDDNLGWETVAGRLVLGRWNVGSETSAEPTATPLSQRSDGGAGRDDDRRGSAGRLGCALGRDWNPSRRLDRRPRRPDHGDLEPLRRRSVRRPDRPRESAAEQRAGTRRVLDRRRSPGLG